MVDYQGFVWMIFGVPTCLAEGSVNEQSNAGTSLFTE